MLFHVIDKRTGERLEPENGCWMIDTDGDLFEVIDGWGCEGGGGSSAAPDHAQVVFAGLEKSDVEHVKHEFQCYECKRQFRTMQALDQHCQDTDHIPF